MASWSSLGLVARPCFVPFCRAFPLAPQSHPSALGPENLPMVSLPNALISALSRGKIQWSCAWDGTALTGDPHSTLKYHKPRV